MIEFIKINTKAGEMIACSVEEGICLLEFSYRRSLPKELDYLREYFKSEIIEAENQHLIELRQQLEEYFEGTRKEFTLPLITLGTDFQKSVWNSLREIPYGTTRSYLEQASLLGRPEAVRAVATANGNNRIAIIIPCHRIIGSDGSLVGYSGGLSRKKWLLNHERKFSGKDVELSLF